MWLTTLIFRILVLLFADLKVQNQTVERAILFVVKKSPIGSRPILIGMDVLQHLPMFKNFLGLSHEESMGYAKAGRIVPPIPACSSIVIEAIGPQELTPVYFLSPPTHYLLGLSFKEL